MSDIAIVEAGLKARQRGTGSTANTKPALAALARLRARLEAAEGDKYVCAHDHRWQMPSGDVPTRCPVCGTTTYRAAKEAKA